MAGLAMIFFGSLWMISPKYNVVGMPDLVVEPKQPLIQIDETVNPPEPPIEGPLPSGRRDVLTANYKQPKRMKLTKVVHKEKPIIVTPEEAAAYDKLMLALAITSSNLRIVQDTVAGIDKESPVRKNDR